MAPKFLPDVEVYRIVRDARSLYKHLLGDGFADLHRMPSDVIGEIPRGAVHRYHPTAATNPDALPTLIVPPIAATAASFDLRRGCSLVEFLLELGRPTYLVNYGDLSVLRDQDLGLEYWLDEVVPHAVSTVSRDSGGRPVLLLGWCLGGLLALFTQAADHELPIAGIATVASPIDYREVKLLGPVRLMETVTRGAATTTLIRVLGGIPDEMNKFVFKWLSPDKQLKRPLTVLRNLDNPDVLAQIEAVDAMMDAMDAYPGRTIAQIYHSFVRTNSLADGTITLSRDRTVSMAGVSVPVLSVAGEGDLVFAPPASAHRIAQLLPNAPQVRLETAPGGHLGVLTGTKARDTTWRYIAQFLADIDGQQREG